MRYGNPTAQTIAELTRAGMPRADIARLTGTKLKDLDNLLHHYQPNSAFDPHPIPDALELGGDFIIIGDVHVPYTDYQFAQLVGRVAEKTGIRRLIIGGDFFTQDNWSKYQHAVLPATWVEERTAARILVQDWLEVFDEIYTLVGNHDARIMKWSAGQIDESDVWGMINTSTKLHHSRLGWCTVNSAGIMWRITHPCNYGRNQLTLASDLANKHQSNIITFHEHHTASGWDVYKRFVCVNGGCLVDPTKLAYVSLDDSRSAGMAPGFVVLRGGVASVLGKYPFSDWTQWLS
jgi:predicted phosphodiesterase